MLAPQVRTVQDKNGGANEVSYIRMPAAVDGTLSDPFVAAALPEILALSYRAFPQYGDDGVERFVRQKLAKARAFALVYSLAVHRFVGFHIYKFLDDFKAAHSAVKVMYIDQGGFDPEGFQNRGLSTRTKEVVLDIERPAIVCSSSGNPAVYRSAEQTARRYDMWHYPTSGTTPPSIVRLAERIIEALGITNATLDSRLVRTYAGPTSRGAGHHPLLDDVLRLGANQHVFNLSIDSRLNEAILRERAVAASGPAAGVV